MFCLLGRAFVASTGSATSLGEPKHSGTFVASCRGTSPPTTRSPHAGSYPKFGYVRPSFDAWRRSLRLTTPQGPTRTALGRSPSKAIDRRMFHAARLPPGPDETSSVAISKWAGPGSTIWRRFANGSRFAIRTTKRDCRRMARIAVPGGCSTWSTRLPAARVSALTTTPAGCMAVAGATEDSAPVADINPAGPTPSKHDSRSTLRWLSAAVAAGTPAQVGQAYA
jgi:hypothetical protein